MASVYFLGAGFSAGSGYPLGHDLLARALAIADAPSFRSLWADSRWLDRFFPGHAAGSFEGVDAELLLTLLDLASIRARRWFDSRRALLDRGEPESAALAGHRGWKRILEAQADLHMALRGCIERFDSESANRGLQPYVASFAARARAGDVIVTTNFDTLAERALQYRGKWRIETGYGLPLSIAHIVEHRDFEAKWEWTDINDPAHPNIIVLKLHGGLGWHVGDAGVPLMDVFRAHKITPNIEYLPDKGSLFFGGSSTLLWPTYVKSTLPGAWKQIWTRAGEALRAADELIVCGYSLPESDTAIRALLLASASSPFAITVVDPCLEVADRWESLLSRPVRHHAATVEDWLA